MPRVRKVPPSATQPSADAKRAVGVRRKHPLLLALVVLALALWLGFLAYLAFRG
jgi:hypothetical protein